MDSFGHSSATAVPTASELDHGVVPSHIRQGVIRFVLSWLRVRKTAKGYILDWFPALSSGTWLVGPILAVYALCEARSMGGACHPYTRCPFPRLHRGLWASGAW